MVVTLTIGYVHNILTNFNDKQATLTLGERLV